MFKRHTWLLLVALSFNSTTLVADDVSSAADSADAKSSQHESIAAAPSGLQVFIDEQTGEVRAPTKAETAAIAEQFRQQMLTPMTDDAVIQHADGSLSKNLGSQDRLYSVARLSDDGELETVCLPGEQVADFLGKKDDTDHNKGAGAPK